MTEREVWAEAFRILETNYKEMVDPHAGVDRDPEFCANLLLAMIKKTLLDFRARRDGTMRRPS